MPYGLPQEVQYVQSLTQEIKRLQIKLMNRVLLAVERGEVDMFTADSILSQFGDSDRSAHHNREFLVKPELRSNIPPQRQQQQQQQ